MPAPANFLGHPSHLLFDGLVVLYREGYDKLVASGKATESIAWSKMILNGLKVMSDGLNKATK